jgi:TatA/E family protein of Tat protein translocase
MLAARNRFGKAGDLFADVRVSRTRRGAGRRQTEPLPRIAGTLVPQYDKGMNLGLPEMIFIFLMALIIFGPKKLPEIGRQVGKALNEFKRASNEFKAQIESEIANLDITEQKPRILPPARSTAAPTGTIATGALEAETPTASESLPSTEIGQVVKAPDA